MFLNLLSLQQDYHNYCVRKFYELRNLHAHKASANSVLGLNPAFLPN
jgi:hypothetical protein